MHLNGQSVDIGLCNHRVDDGLINFPQIVKLHGEAEIPASNLVLSAQSTAGRFEVFPGVQIRVAALDEKKKLAPGTK
ncbi:MAG: hypothetical protein CVU64_09735 [Deltaproteobacteria bacterium HGW-Deltaproteobacteria-21]|nr:MAG: hypothetical protein CVU64_09735 [Deltaproteobacteria bacterium HGW-Deltaproteobacteria-21]